MDLDPDYLLVPRTDRPCLEFVQRAQDQLALLFEVRGSSSDKGRPESSRGACWACAGGGGGAGGTDQKPADGSDGPPALTAPRRSVSIPHLCRNPVCSCCPGLVHLDCLTWPRRKVQRVEQRSPPTPTVVGVFAGIICPRVANRHGHWIGVGQHRNRDLLRPRRGGRLGRRRVLIPAADKLVSRAELLAGTPSLVPLSIVGALPGIVGLRRVRQWLPEDVIPGELRPIANARGMRYPVCCVLTRLIRLFQPQRTAGGAGRGQDSEPTNDIACTPSPPSPPRRPELLSRLSGEVPRCSALPIGELPIWSATCVPAASPCPANSVSVRLASSLLPGNRPSLSQEPVCPATSGESLTTMGAAKPCS